MRKFCDIAILNSPLVSLALKASAFLITNVINALCLSSAHKSSAHVKSENDQFP